MKTRWTAALCQMDAGPDRDRNLRTAERLVTEAAERGASLAVLPELFSLTDQNGPQGEDIPGGPTVNFMAELARRLGICIHCGSIPEQSPDGGRVRNTSVLLGADGSILARYSKLHMFDITLPNGEPNRESDTVRPGESIVTAETELGCFGLSICYDIRFPELYRLLALKGAQVLLIPAEFNRDTGALHWEVLARARAIENRCYVLACDQTGVKNLGFPCCGNSMIIDPDGRILARAGTEEAVILAEIDLDRVTAARESIPSLKNRRTDLYTINGF